MRNLTIEEIEEALDDNGETEDGCIAIEATVQELSDLKVGTTCGTKGNSCFVKLAEKGYAHRKCRGWFDEKTKEIVGMCHIKIQTDKTAEKIEKIAAEAGGSLRFNGDSLWEGYKEFEIE